MISVLMCTYNRERFLERAINSVLGQTYKDIEFIIVDDGSTDRSEEIIKSCTDSRIQYVKMKRNSFYCYAANCGLTYCRGEYVAFMNSDDVWLPDKLEKQLEFMEENTQYGACFTAVSLMDDEEQDVSDKSEDLRNLFARQHDSQKEWMRSLFYDGNSLCHPSAMVRKSVLDKVGGFNIMYRQLADYDLWLRILIDTPIHVLPEQLIRFRWDEKSQNQVISATEEHRIRTSNEQVLISRNLIDAMSDEKFREFFGEDFQNPSSSTHLEIELEKCLLMIMAKGWTAYLRTSGLDRLEKVLQDPDAFDVLHEHFHINIFDIYNWDKEHLYVSELEYQSWQALFVHYQTEAQKEKDKVNQLERKIEEYELSKSWKMTAPFRRVMGIIRGITKQI